MSLLDNLCAVFNLHVDICPDCVHSFESPIHELQLCRVGEALGKMADDQAATEWLHQAGEKARAG